MTDPHAFAWTVGAAFFGTAVALILAQAIRLWLPTITRRVDSDARRVKRKVRRGR